MPHSKSKYQRKVRMPDQKNQELSFSDLPELWLVELIQQVALTGSKNNDHVKTLFASCKAASRATLQHYSLTMITVNRSTPVTPHDPESSHASVTLWGSQAHAKAVCALLGNALQRCLRMEHVLPCSIPTQLCGMIQSLHLHDLAMTLHDLQAADFSGCTALEELRLSQCEFLGDNPRLKQSTSFRGIEGYMLPQNVSTKLPRLRKVDLCVENHFGSSSSWQLVRYLCADTVSHIVNRHDESKGPRREVICGGAAAYTALVSLQNLKVLETDLDVGVHGLECVSRKQGFKLVANGPPWRVFERAGPRSAFTLHELDVDWLSVPMLQFMGGMLNTKIKVHGGLVPGTMRSQIWWDPAVQEQISSPLDSDSFDLSFVGKDGVLVVSGVASASMLTRVLKRIRPTVHTVHVASCPDWNPHISQQLVSSLPNGVTTLIVDRLGGPRNDTMATPAHGVPDDGTHDVIQNQGAANSELEGSTSALQAYGSKPEGQAALLSFILNSRPSHITHVHLCTWDHSYTGWLRMINSLQHDGTARSTHVTIKADISALPKDRLQLLRRLFELAHERGVTLDIPHGTVDCIADDDEGIDDGWATTDEDEEGSL